MNELVIGRDKVLWVLFRLGNTTTIRVTTTARALTGKGLWRRSRLRRLESAKPLMLCILALHSFSRCIGVGVSSQSCLGPQDPASNVVRANGCALLRGMWQGISSTTVGHVFLASPSRRNIHGHQPRHMKCLSRALSTCREA